MNIDWTCFLSSLLAGSVVGSLAYIYGYKKGYSTALEWSTKRMNEVLRRK